ncbi:hypothetical protein BU16DRAFT_594765 [Lophium mytilinum]|uniref:Lysine-specific metallo-endopeptidase domain-containing protein n=1 Tax=Lophium mytilinum TaxID=390894 RepID=A0A6A6QH13_9PEZI|nr:hypothetical protein BU16DRAFT_594765 [Lophium mytilinum]
MDSKTRITLMPLVVMRCINPITGYMIDPVSCTGDDLTFVRDGMNAAFQMADNAFQETQGSLHEKTLELIRWLLPKHTIDKYTSGQMQDGVADINEAGIPFAGKNVHFTTESMPINWILEVFGGIISMRNEVSDERRMNTMDVKVFCNTDRYKKRDDNLWWDEDIEEVMTGGDEDTPVTESPGARCYAKVNQIPTVMFTSEGPDYDLITICPPFLAIAKKRKWKLSDGFGRSFLAKVASYMNLPTLYSKLKFSPIDLMSLFEKTLVHELTHTQAGGDKDDVEGFDSYGWKNCRRIAQYPEDKVVEEGQATNNADTFALFASAISLRLKSPPLYVKQDGKVTSKYETPSPNG